MKLSFLLSGNAPVKKKYQIGETWLAVAGIPVEYPTLADTAGVLMCETNSCVDALGMTTDQPFANNGKAARPSTTRLTAQQSDGSDPSQVVTVIVNPGAVWKARLSGGATSGTALTAQANTVASTDGLLITTTANNSAYDDGVAWGATGANAGILRKLTALTTSGVPIIAFPFDIAVGDTFFYATFGPGEDAGFQLTTNLDEIDATADLQGTDNFRCIDFFHKDAAQEGATKTYAEFLMIDHVFGGNIT
jgi:hypothetical protein